MLEMTEKFIELVRNEPYLYDTSHIDYSSKALKELAWEKIAKKMNYKDGLSAKEAWLKLRNCHRDAIRRRNKLYKSSSAATVYKPWKFENQMDFLVTHMSNRLTAGIPMEEINLTQPDDLINYKQEDEFEHNITGDNSPEDSAASSPTPLSQTDISLIVPPKLKRSTKKNYFNTLISKALHSHENRIKDCIQKRLHNRNEEDDLQHFFNTMYAITKKMPAISQHQLKKRIFNIVSDEEERLLYLDNVNTNSNLNTITE